MEQAQSLKLNVTNIHKFLVGSNKQLAKLKKDKQNLLFKYEKQAQRRKKESKIEAKDFGIGGGLKRVASAVSRPAMSFFDRIKEFFGVILLGLLINNLPKILAELKKFFNSGFIKGLRSFLSIIGKGFMAFVDITLSLPQSVRNAFDKTKNDIENQLNAVGGTLDSLVRFFTGGSDNNDTNTESSSGSSGGSTAGSSPTRIPTIPFAPSAPGNAYPLTVPGYNKGGIVGSTPGTSNSVPARYSKGGMGIFGAFGDSVGAISNVTAQEEQNIMTLASIVDSYEYITRVEGKEKSGVSGTPSTSGSPGKIKKGSSITGTYASGAYVGPSGDTDGEQTGLNMNLPGGIGTPIYAPFDMIYRARGTDGMPAVGLQGTADALGPSGRGFGYYGAYYYMKDGKEYEVLMGHFRDLPYKGANDGDVIPKGTLLGYQGASGRSVSSTGGVYPHISLHVNGVGFRATNAELESFASGLMGGSGPSKKPVKNPNIKPSNKGGSRSYKSSKSGGSGSVFIYAIQPQVEYVPMPYPVPVRQPSMTQNTQPPKPSALWRA